MDPNGKVALITGGARIGQVVAAALAKRGCSLALTYRGSRDAADQTAAAARAAGVKAAVFQADATDESQIVAAVSETAKSLGRLDILINMAAIYEKTPNPDGALWSSIQDTNAKSAFMYSHHAAPIMKKNGAGRIVNFSDWLPVTGRPRYKDYVPYYVSKASVAALTEALALQLAPDDTGQRDRAGSNPGATQPDGRRKCASDRGHTARTMGRRRGDREDGDVLCRDGLRHRRIHSGGRRPSSFLKNFRD